MAQSDWAIQLFNKSVLKQQKFKEITAMLGSTDRLDCLDIGGDNGVISYMLRSQGGNWKSADLDTESVAAIEELIQSKVYRIDNDRLPFSTKEFDRIVVVDFLEHIQDEKWFFEELQRILKPGGILLLNVPHLKNDLLRKLRILLGQTDEKHGHLRPGYTMTMVEKLIEDKFILLEYKTYSKFFSEFLDLVIVGLVSRIQQNNGQPSPKGQLILENDLQNRAGMFRIYSFIYPIIKLSAWFDKLLFFQSGYKLIIKVGVRKISAESQLR